MIRYKTANRDQLIYKELRRGHDPKAVAMRLNLRTKKGKPDVDAVYKAMARDRQAMLLPLAVVAGPERRSRHLNLPKFAKDKDSHERAREGSL
jgi:hypothetical protein